MRDATYEMNRISDESSFLRKMRIKRVLYALFGEIYVGRRVKLSYFRKWLERLALPEGASICELGSGDGVFCFYLADACDTWKVTGLEINAAEAAVCEQIARENRKTNLRFRAETLEDCGDAHGLDLVFCLDVLEHIENDLDALRGMFEALRPGGRLLIHVPNSSFLETDGELIQVPDGEAWKINPGHVRQGYAPEELRNKLERTGFKVEEIRQTQGHPITYAHRLYARVEKIFPLRIGILPLLDALIWLDHRIQPKHGNTVWALASREA